MKVKIFDEEDEKDLEDDINEFIDDTMEVIDIKYQVSVSIFSEEQVYCFSAMIIYASKWFIKWFGVGCKKWDQIYYKILLF